MLATLSPEEVNEDRLKFSQQLIDEADDDIKTLGLELDVLKIQNVTDDVNYLESVGRRLTAEVIRDARVAEANRTAESEQAEASARRTAQVAQIEADKKIVEEQNALRVRTAELEAISRAREEEALVAGETAKAVASQELETERIELEKRRVEADVVVPARADLEARQLQAQAEAATIVEDGKAQVEVFKRLTDQYQAAGADGHDVLVLNMLPDLIDKIVATVQNVSIDRVAVVDTGAGGGRKRRRQRRRRLPRRHSRAHEPAPGVAGGHDRADRGRHRGGHPGLAAPPRRAGRRELELRHWS